MKKALIFIFLSFSIMAVNAQISPDTAKIKVFTYSSANRDTSVMFPEDSDNNFEKIIMRYSMRCKNGLVSSSSDRNRGCGEWDYSCNTFIVDSSQYEQVEATTPEYIISDFIGDQFNYTTNPLFDYYKYILKHTTVSQSESRTDYTIGSQDVINEFLLATNKNSGKTQFLYKADELHLNSLSAGPIEGIVLYVSDSGGEARFLRIKMANYSLPQFSYLDSDNGEMKQVFYDNYIFSMGGNEIIFNAPFYWDGTSDILIEISFTNSVPQHQTFLYGDLVESTRSLYTNNNYSVDLSSGGRVFVNGSNLSSIDKEISVGFWAFGDQKLPINNSILWGYDQNKSDRMINIHLPWSNESIYFDCGFSAGNYDRIDKQSTASIYKGRWNYWTFTKNATNGTMKIFLNGALWHSGTSKTRSMKISNLILGDDSSFSLNYKGKVNEFTVWNKELDANTINSWMNKSIDDSHPYYNSLLTYLKMDQNSGQNIYDHKNSLVSSGENLKWNFDRGISLNHNFNESNFRPKITFVKGDFTKSSQNIEVIDSILRSPNIVIKYKVKSNDGVVPFKSDEIVKESATELWESKPVILYDGDSGSIISQKNITPTGTISIKQLKYIQRFPFYSEIMSFVTPYGINLDLGPNGKSWYFDVSDFAPLLKNNKRIIMSMGGQNQEDNEIEFYFIKGVPPRKVLSFDQLWQGSFRLGGVGIKNIINQSVFKPRTLNTLSEGAEFKLRSVITGHGAEGEFQVNGGTIHHIINVDGSDAIDIDLNKNCSLNPIFPQGGTWVYDRQGWCPGEFSTVNENFITDYIEAGAPVTFSYSTSNPSNSSGDYRYLVAHDLITYGKLNFNNDARVIDILKPTTNVLYTRDNPICSKPIIRIQNSGKNNIQNVEFHYWVNSDVNVETFTWTGNIASMQNVDIELPINNIWKNVVPNNENIFNIQISKVNGVSDDYQPNNTMKSQFYVPLVLPANFIIEFKTNSKPGENSYKILDADGGIVDNKTFSNANKIYSNTYNLYGCYKLELKDSGEDGIDWWANTSQGVGYFKIKDSNGQVIKTIQPDFGSKISVEFTTDNALSTNLMSTESVQIYPQPASTDFIVDVHGINISNMVITDIAGKKLDIPFVKTDNVLNFKSSTLQNGIYFISLYVGEVKVTKKVVIINQ